MASYIHCGGSTPATFQLPPAALTVTLHHLLDASHLLECVDVLCEVAQQFAVLLEQLDEAVTHRRLELTRVDLLQHDEDRT